jgi:hypothetical protein
MSKHSELQTNAEQAIAALKTDTSVGMRETLDSLDAVQERLAEDIQILESELAAQERDAMESGAYA